LIVRKARPAEATSLTEIAHQAKRHWGYPEHWIQHWQADLTILPELIEHNDVYIAEEEGRILGFYALCRTQSGAELDHLWVVPDRIGTGVGKQLFLHAMERAAMQRIDNVLITADPNAAGFYEKMGAEQTGEVISEIDGRPRKLPKLTVKPR